MKCQKFKDNVNHPELLGFYDCRGPLMFSFAAIAILLASAGSKLLDNLQAWKITNEWVQRYDRVQFLCQLSQQISENKHLNQLVAVSTKTVTMMV